MVKFLAFGARGMDSKSHHYYIRDLVSPAFNLRYDWNDILHKSSKQPDTALLERN